MFALGQPVEPDLLAARSLVRPLMRKDLLGCECPSPLCFATEGRLTAFVAFSPAHRYPLPLPLMTRTVLLLLRLVARRRVVCLRAAVSFAFLVLLLRTFLAFAFDFLAVALGAFGLAAALGLADGRTTGRAFPSDVVAGPLEPREPEPFAAPEKPYSIPPWIVPKEPRFPPLDAEDAALFRRVYGVRFGFGAAFIAGFFTAFGFAFVSFTDLSSFRRTAFCAALLLGFGFFLPPVPLEEPVPEPFFANFPPLRG